MKKFVDILFLFYLLEFIIRGVFSISDDNCIVSASTQSTNLKLKNNLFCNYDKDVRPVLDSEKTVNVNFEIFPKYMESDSGSNNFVLNFWLKMDWTDDHLNWNPENYESIKTIFVRSHDLWMPDILFYDIRKHRELSSTTCTVSNIGNVTCIMSIQALITCESDYTYWPYDKQECSLDCGSKSYYMDEVDLHHSKVEPEVSMDIYTPNREWNMTSVTKMKTVYTTFIGDLTQLRFKFNLKRHSKMSHSTYVVPAVFLMSFTLMILCLESRSFERIILASVNFVCHLLCIYDLHWIVPSNGPKIPHILIFFRDSLILAAFVLVMTIVSRKLRKLTAAAPEWISRMVFFMKDYRLLRFLVIDCEESREHQGSRRDTANDSESPQLFSLEQHDKEPIWTCLSNLIEWISLLSIFVTYFTLLLILLPQSE